MLKAAMCIGLTSRAHCVKEDISTSHNTVLKLKNIQNQVSELFSGYCVAFLFIYICSYFKI